MKTKNVPGIICLVIFSLFSNHAWATDWILYSSPSNGNMYYDKSSIKKVNKNISRVWTKKVLNEDGQKEYFSIFKSEKYAPDIPEKMSHIIYLQEFDCVNEKNKIPSMVVYDKKNNAVYSDSKDDDARYDEWKDIIPDSVTEKLRNIVCSGDKNSKTDK